MGSEQVVRRNPHPDFGKVQASRPDWNDDTTILYTKTKHPAWKPADGSNDNEKSLKKDHVEIDPYEEGRMAVSNYKLLISAIVPRPIAFLSTQSKDGKSNLAPFSYFQVVNHDPPIFTIGFSGGFDRAKDSIRNLVETGEGCINIISEHFIEAANCTSVNAPHGISEWTLAGLHPAPCSIVKPPRVKESLFSIEAKLLETKEFESKANPGRKSGILAIIEGIKFWAREDAINEDKNQIDPAILRPIARLGGITYSRLGDIFEIPRPSWDSFSITEEAKNLL